MEFGVWCVGFYGPGFRISDSGFRVYTDSTGDEVAQASASGPMEVGCTALLRCMKPHFGVSVLRSMV